MRKHVLFSYDNFIFKKTRLVVSYLCGGVYGVGESRRGRPVGGLVSQQLDAQRVQLQLHLTGLGPDHLPGEDGAAAVPEEQCL